MKKIVDGILNEPAIAVGFLVLVNGILAVVKVIDGVQAGAIGIALAGFGTLFVRQTSTANAKTP